MKRLLLFVSLLSTLAQSMETAVIKDVNGQEFILNQAQKNALGQCKTLKSMLQDCENSPQIDFEGLAAPVVKSTILELIQCIENPSHVSRVPDERIIDLFRLADYLNAPKKVATTLAERVEQLVNMRIAQLDNVGNLNEAQEAEYADLKALEQSIQKHLGISMSKWLENKFKGSTPEGFPLDLSCKPDTKSRNKLRRLNGIEKIENRNLVAFLNLDNHNISTVDLAYLDRVFPRLTQLSLKSNRIEKIHEKSPLRAIVVNLESNPLKSITIENPERSNYLTFITDNPRVKVDFPQSKWAKNLTWLKSVNAKVKAILEYLLPSRGTIIMYGLIYGGMWGYANQSHENVLREILKKDPTEVVAVVDKTIFCLSKEANGGELIYFFANFFFKFAKYRGTDALVAHSKLMPIREAILNSQVPLHPRGYIDSIASYGSCAAKVALYCAVFGVGLQAIACLSGDASVANYLRLKAVRNPYRIKIQNGDAVIQEFPSNYTYNLFDKF